MKIDKRKLSTNLSADQRLALELKQLASSRQQVMGKFAFGLVKTWEDFNRITGFVPSDVSVGVTKDTIAGAFAARESIIRNPPVEIVEAKPVEPVITFKAKAPDDFDTPIPSLSDNPEVIPEPDQIRATNIALHMLMVQGYQGIGLNAEVGSGKTFILGALIAELWRRKWKVLTECVSPPRYLLL